MRLGFALSRLCVLGVAFSSAADAATVQVSQTKLQIDQGKGFRSIAAATVAKAGDRVMAGPDGAGQIVYDDGCIVQVNPGAVITIGVRSPCAAGLNGKLPPPTPLDHYLLGAAAVGGAVAGVVLLTQKSGSNPASP